MEEGNAGNVIFNNDQRDCPDERGAQSFKAGEFLCIVACDDQALDRSVLGSALYLSDFPDDFLNFFKWMR